MKVLIDKSFEKDVKKIADQKILTSIADCIEEAKAAKKIGDLKNQKKLKGSKIAYRIRIGDYRLGFIFENNTIIFIRFLHRSRMYTNFP